MNSKKGKKSGSCPKIADSRIYPYDEIIECQEKLNDSNEFQFDIDDGVLISPRRRRVVNNIFIFLFLK